MTGTQNVHWMCACVALVVVASDAAAQSADNATGGEISVELSITHTVLDNEGNPALPASAPTVFKVTRSRRSAKWQTVVTYRKHPGPSTRASSHPLDGARVEFDEDSGATRVYDSTGELNSLLSRESTSGLPVPPGPGQWLEGLIATEIGRSKRARDLVEKYGKPVGRVGGMDRFLTYGDGTVEEVLADPGSALPREINTVRDGVLESHIVFDYERVADGAWIRRSMRAEHFMPGNPGHRSRTTVEFTNLFTGGK